MPGQYNEAQHRRSRDGRFTTKPVLAASTTTHADVHAATATENEPLDPAASTPQGPAATDAAAIDT